MVPLAALWLPILVTAVLIFIASSLIHMVFKWHNADYLKFTNEDEVRAAIRSGGAAPGPYTRSTARKKLRKLEPTSMAMGVQTEVIRHVLDDGRGSGRDCGTSHESCPCLRGR